MRDELFLTTPLFVQAEEEHRCEQHLKSGKAFTIGGLAPSGRRRQVTGVVRSIMRGSILHPGYPLMLTIRERIEEPYGIRPEQD
jgi:hypothetical protein